MKEKYGIFSSWEILSDTVAIKHCDLSVFKYNGTNISLHNKWFWDIENISPSDNVPVALFYKGKEYSANIGCYQNGLIQMYFSKEFGDIIKSQISHAFIGLHIHEITPSIRFEKIEEGIFNISFIREETIDNESQEDLTSQVEDKSFNFEGKEEGKRIKYYTTKYERDAKNRAAAIKFHGTTCAVCGFDFEKAYGNLGRDYIEVHHIKPLSSLDAEIKVNPETDLVCLCSNCHRMIHRHRDKVLSVDELIGIMNGYEGAESLFKKRYFASDNLPLPIAIANHPGSLTENDRFENISRMIEHDGVEVDDDRIWDYVFNLEFDDYDHTNGGWLEEVTDKEEIENIKAIIESYSWLDFLKDYGRWSNMRNYDAEEWEQYLEDNKEDN